MSAAKPPHPPSRRRIAGESKPSVSAPPSAQPAESKRAPLSKPKLPKRPKAPKAEKPPKAEPVTRPVEVDDVVDVAATSSAAPAPLPAAPPRLDAARVPRTKPSPMLLGLIALALASLGFGGVGAWYGFEQWQKSNVANSREAAADAAASAAETIFTYQYNKLDEHLRKAQETMTPSFAAKFKSVSPALQALAPQRKVQVKAVVRNAATAECGDSCSPERATVLVFIDQARVADGAERPTVFGNRIKMSMVERDGKWFVNDIKTL